MTRFLHALHKSRRCGLYIFVCLQIYSKVKTLTQVCEGKGNEVMVSLLLGCNIAVISMQYRRCQDAMPVSLERIYPCRQDMVSRQQDAYVRVVGTGCWHRQDMVGVVGTGCQCHWDRMSVLSGCSVGIIGTWCQSHWDGVLASSGGSVSIVIVRRQGALS